MSQADREKWDTRYSDGSYLERVNPTQLLVERLPQLPVGRALDVACGAGRNALFLAESGYEVDAVDISPVALERARHTATERGVEVNWIRADLDIDDLPAGPFALVLMIRFVSDALLPRLFARLMDGGHFVCEQHLVTNVDVVGPRNPDFRVRPGELLARAEGLEVIHYREGLVVDPDGRRAALAQLVARR